ncbi:MAG TPA: MFS transporter [Ktedonobacterales bacterium]|jgi:MFS family permease|nr:MFS transporter [Ktedonobacterales bacterium]
MPSIEAPASTRKPGLLINRDFGLLWAGQSISAIGDALLDFTLALWIAFDLGRGQSWAPLAVSGVMVSSSVGTLVIGPIAGVFVDRWDKRRTLLAFILIQAILTASLLVVANLVPLPFFAGGHPSLDVTLAVLYTVSFLVYGCAQFTRAARTALIGDLVAERDRPQASGLIETMANLSFLIGFGMAPLLFVPFGIGFALVADALSFVVAFGAFLAVKAPPSVRSVKRGERGNIRREFFEGLRFSFGNLVIRTLLVVYTLVLFGSGAINALFVFFLAQDLHAPRAAIGAFPVVLGLGLVLGSILGSALARRVGLTRIFWISVVLIGIAAIVLSRQSSFVPGLVCAFLLGVPNGVMNVALMPLVLHITPKALVGRVMTVLEPAMTVAQVASVAVFGTLASTVLSGFHAQVLGATLDTYGLLILIPGLLCLLAGTIAFASLRHGTLAGADPAGNAAQN